MKSIKMKNKALELYITNVPIDKIAKRLKITKQTIHDWKSKGGWKQLRTESLRKIDLNLTDKVVKEQLEITKLAQERLIEHLNNDELKGNELVALTKHRLELVRPKEVNNNLNITKNENTAIQVVIPKAVEELLQKEVVVSDA